MILFVWLIVFNITLLRADDDGDEDGDGDSFSFDCPCWPDGYIEDILGECDATVDNPLNIACLGLQVPIFVVELNTVICGNGDFADERPILAALTSPLFTTIDSMFFDVGVCVNSPNGILGLLRFIFEAIFDSLDGFDDCFGGDDRRRLSVLQGSDGTGTTPADTNPFLNQFHGSVVSFEYFVELLENNALDRSELLNLIFQEGGIAQLVMRLKNKAGTGTTAAPSGTRRRLLDDDDDDDDFDECGFGFLPGFLSDPTGSFDVADSPFEALLGTLFAGPDCENNFDETPILCILQDVFDRRRRRLASRKLLDDSEDDDDDDDDDRDVLIQLSFDEQIDTCFFQLRGALRALNGQEPPCDVINLD